MTIPIITAALITIVAGWMIIKRYPVHIVFACKRFNHYRHLHFVRYDAIFA